MDPRESLEPRWRYAARRALLYGGAAALVGAGLWAHAALARRALEAQLPRETLVVHAGRLGQKRVFDLLLESGSAPREAAEVSAALGRAARVRRLLPEDGYRIERLASGEFLHLTLSSGLKRVVVARRGGSLRASSGLAPVSTVRRRGAGTLSGSLWASMESAGVPPQVIADFSDVYRWTVDFLTEPRDGDRFAVLWEERRDPAGRVLGRSILSALYDGRETERREALRFDRDYYDEKGDSLRRMFLRAPLQFRSISSSFSRRRYHPILRHYRAHHGTDYSAPRGTPVVSVAQGTVVFAGRNRGYGNLVEVRHGPVYSTRYAHLSRFAKGVRKGASLSQGEVLGFVGSTGLATGPHLHFEIQKGGRPENFLRLNLPFARSVPKERREEFRALLARRRAELDALLASLAPADSGLR